MGTRPGRPLKTVLFPREHGAYAQLGLPLLTVFLVGRPTLSAVLLTVTAWTGFFAHGPLFVLVGRRGIGGRGQALPPERRRMAQRLLGWLAPFGLITGLIGVSGLTGWLPLAWDMGLVTVAILLLFIGEERNTPGEVIVAAALAGASWPIADAAGLSEANAWALATGWTLAVVGGTWSARVVLEQRRRARGLGARIAPIAVLIAGAIGLASVSPGAGLGALPMLLVALFGVIRPLPPQALARIGWAMAGAGLASAAIMATGFLVQARAGYG